jgi:lipid A ethanolaminephosphotransferase
MIKNWINKFKHLNITISAINFIGLYTLATILIYNFVFWSKIINAITFDNIFDILFLATFVVIISILLFIITSILFIKYTTKFLACTLITINSSALYFMNAYGVPLDKGMIANVFATDINEATDLFNIKLLFHIVFLGIIPSILILKIKIVYKKLLKEILYRITFCLVLLIIALILAGIQYRQVSTFVRSNNQTFNYLLPRNYIWSLIKIIKTTKLEDKKLINIDDDLKIQDDNILAVIVVGETARKNNFSLYGYERETNPLLKTDNIIALKNVTSCGTSTKVSLPCMFSHLDRKSFIQNNKKYEFAPSLLARNGVNVLYKDNNFGGCKGTCDGTETVKTVDLNIEEFCQDDKCLDGVLLNNLNKYIKDHNKNTMIILHQNGSHGPRYNKRYPKNFEKFKPVCENSDVSKCTQEELVNAYDNTIIYTDYVLHNAIEIIKASNRPAILIYISDHGESLGENNIYLHGFPYRLAPKEQKEIPMLLWMSESFRQKHDVVMECFNKQDYSHDNLFHTLIGIFNGKTSLYDTKLDVLKCN